MMNHQISIIIPVLNEESCIGKLLEHLLANSSAKNISEIIVVDGGSFDNTINIVQAFSNFTCIYNKEAFNYIDSRVLEDKSISTEVLRTPINILDSEKGRAKQMNLGVKSATGDILYFLHADSLPPKCFDTLIIKEVEKENQAGCFRMQFESKHWFNQIECSANIVPCMASLALICLDEGCSNSHVKSCNYH